MREIVPAILLNGAPKMFVIFISLPAISPSSNRITMRYADINFAIRCRMFIYTPRFRVRQIYTSFLIDDAPRRDEPHKVIQGFQN